MKVEQLINNDEKKFHSYTFLQALNFTRNTTNKQPIKMEKSTPKPREKKPQKIDVAIARIEDKIEKIDKQIYELVQLNKFYEQQLSDLKTIKNDKDLI